METTQTSQSLYQALWNSADVLRSKMDANDYKSYLLGMIFYKYLSDKLLFFVAETMLEETEDLNEALALYRSYYEDPASQEELISVVSDELNYFLKPDLTFTALVDRVNEGTFQLEDLAQGFHDIEQSDDLYENLFEDIELYSKKLGATPQKQNQLVAAVMKELAVLDVAGHAGDMLGDAYEYLIGQFATDSGKKAGEFYTPQPVAKLMTQIAFLGREDEQGFTIYDATMGSGSLLLNAKKFSHQPQTVQSFGQELNTSTYNLARLNMILHGVPVENQFLHNADTLDEDWPTQEPTNFDGVLMNPPYSAKWSASSGFLQDPRFSPFGKLAPQSKADFAFLLHGYYHLKQDNGVMAIVLPHGVLFRGNAEGTIRKALLEEGAIDTVIGLPANIFFNTSIPTTVIILKKNRTNRDVYFIDASKEFDKGKNQNIMTDAHIEKILQAYKSREDMDKFAHLARFEEIVENDYNLNIPRYVDTFEEEEVEPLTDIVAKINQTNATIETQTASLLDMLSQLRKIQQLAPLLEENIQHQALLLSPKKYNEVIASGYNAVSVKVALHNQAIYLLLNKGVQAERIVIDAFTTAKNYQKYVKAEKNQVTQAIELEEKAESKYLAVAVSSIIARNLFLQNLEDLGKELGFNLPSGAGSKSDQVAAKLLQTYGMKALDYCAKLHFKNTEKAKKLLER